MMLSIRSVEADFARVDSKGATMLEFALVIGVVMLFVVGLIDFSRYILAQNLLTRGAEFAVNHAKKDMRLTRDMRPGSAKPADVLQFKAARNETIDDALGLPHVLNAPSSADSTQRLYSYRLPDPDVGYVPPNAGAVEADAALILPGQTVQMLYKNDAGQDVVETIQHPTCPSPPAVCDGLNEPGPNGWEQTLLTHPIVVELRTRVPLLILGGKTVDVVGRSAAWVERVPISDRVPIVNPPAPTPTPTPAGNGCAAMTEAEACAGKCTDQQLRCKHLPSAVPPNCYTCEELKCSEWTTPEAYSIAHCGGPNLVDFRPDNVGTDCGPCANVMCGDWMSEGDYCQMKGCPLDPTSTRGCDFRYWNQAPNCGECYTKFCIEYTSQAAECGRLNCGAQGANKGCYYQDWAQAPNCAECYDKDCRETTTQAAACGALNCEAQGANKGCYYNEWAKAPNCAQCYDKDCRETTNRDQACGALNCEAQGPNTGCYYNEWAKAPNCAECYQKSCQEVTTQAAACAQANCSAQGPNSVCIFNQWGNPPNCAYCEEATQCQQTTTAQAACAQMSCNAAELKVCQFLPSNNPSAGCATCRPMKCAEWKTRTQYCADKGCSGGQTCEYYGGADAPNCGTGACQNLRCGDYTDSQQACSTANCPSQSTTCQFLANNIGPNCTTCVPKKCGDIAGKYDQVCAAIGCDGPNSNCVWDANSTDLATCGARCEGTPCNQLSAAQACQGNSCSVPTQRCELNASGVPPNCSTCRNLRCSEYTSSAEVCQCQGTDVCQWFPDNFGGNCGGCVPTTGCQKTCPPETQLDPDACACIGGT